MLVAGTQAPSFSLPDQNGQTHTLEEYRGQKVVLYFYPKDNTPGCTKQACAFGELYPQFREKGAVVLGVSKDSVASHKKFEEKYGLPFTILSDEGLEAIKAYDVWQEKNMYGKKTMGVVRTTYLIDESGVIVRHLILPGRVAESKAVLDWIAAELPGAWVSLMAQYVPMGNVRGVDQLERRLAQEEYDEVVDHLFALGLEDGFVQELSSAEEKYIPAFDLTGVPEERADGRQA